MCGGERLREARRPDARSKPTCFALFPPPPGAVLFATTTPPAPRRPPERRRGRMPSRAAAVPPCNGGAWRLCLAVVLLGGIAAAQAAAQTVTLSVPAGTSLAEDGSSRDVEVTATLSSARTSATVVTLSLGGTARSTDYAVQSLPTITIPANGTTASGTLIIAAVDDNFWETAETVEITGSAGSLTVTGAQIGIVDGESRPELRMTLSRDGFFAARATNVILNSGRGCVTTAREVGKVRSTERPLRSVSCCSAFFCVAASPFVASFLSRAIVPVARSCCEERPASLWRVQKKTIHVFGPVELRDLEKHGDDCLS